LREHVTHVLPPDVYRGGAPTNAARRSSATEGGNGDAAYRRFDARIAANFPRFRYVAPRVTSFVTAAGERARVRLPYSVCPCSGKDRWRFPAGFTLGSWDARSRRS